jgi:predicted lipoprotein with Yx(FWY)xxD motif
MRKSIIAAALFAVALSAGAASAQSMPAGVKVANQALNGPSGKALYTYDEDTMKGMSHCNAQCARDWPPLAAKAGDMPMGDWTIITRDDHKLQWAYKGKPLYYYAKDKSGDKAQGAQVKDWKVAHP